MLSVDAALDVHHTKLKQRFLYGEVSTKLAVQAEGDRRSRIRREESNGQEYRGGIAQRRSEGSDAD